jgi:hypothetical protein
MRRLIAMITVGFALVFGTALVVLNAQQSQAYACSSFNCR